MAVLTAALSRSPRRFPVLLRLLLVPLVAALTLLGLWVAGGVITDDFRISMVLTGLWFGGAGLAAALVAWRWRPLALSVLGTFVVTSALVGGYLAYATFHDRVVHEQVAVSSAPGNVGLASGQFTTGAHPTSGRAAVVQLPDGSRVLTLTAFATSPGPDLRVYLVRGDDPGDPEDLGRLKGNRGEQQYAIPGGVDIGEYSKVVIWCRAFSVEFGSARLGGRQ